MTICIPYYDAPQMLAEQLRHWSMYHDEAKAQIGIIVVDDGSPTVPALSVIEQHGTPGMWFRLYRIKENKPWNVSGALNLALHHAPDGWCFSAALDHVLPEECVLTLLNHELDPKKYYRIPRYRMVDLITSDNYPMNGYGNLFLLTKSLFWRLGGYDEDFSGWYGGMGNIFRRELNRHATEEILDGVYHFCYNGLLDGEVRDWGRKDSKYYFVHNIKLKRKRSMRYAPTNPLRFEWEQQI